MATKIISKSTKPRSGVLYYNDGRREYDKAPVQWKQIVELREAGYKKKNGKPALISNTFHVPA